MRPPVAGSRSKRTGAGTSTGIGQIEKNRRLEALAPKRAPEALDLAQRLRMPGPRDHLLDAVLAEYQPEIIFHAAAHKHVPLMEENNAWQAVRNNAYGTWVLARAADQALPLLERVLLPCLPLRKLQQGQCRRQSHPEC